MRKILLSVLGIFFCVSVAEAASCYGTKMPQKNQFFAGGESYVVFKRYQEHQQGKMRSAQEFLLVSYGIFDWLSIDLKGGAGYIKQHPHGIDELDYPTYMGGGYGVRLRVFEKNAIKSVLGFQHISIHPYSINIGPIKHKAVLDDWQVSWLGSYEFRYATPYIGTRLSRMDYIHWVDGVRNRVKSDGSNSVGLILGITVPLIKNSWLNVEGSLFDAEAVAASVNVGF
ncbi:MAG TPA: hypothetical protein PLO85_02500 [Candidatus Omnitrophota bacterium]|nr:hypothetical protein [Candidatus Omnitrophota bacterium]